MHGGAGNQHWVNGLNVFLGEENMGVGRVMVHGAEWGHHFPLVCEICRTAFLCGIASTVRGDWHHGK
jgi:hypothetical protein